MIKQIINGLNLSNLTSLRCPVNLALWRILSFMPCAPLPASQHPFKSPRAPRTPE